MVNLTFILKVIPAFINIAVAVLPVIYWDYEVYLIISFSFIIIYIFNINYINYIIGNNYIFTYRKLLPKLIYINNFSGGKNISYIKLISLLC